jgi:hypothetical protein
VALALSDGHEATNVAQRDNQEARAKTNVMETGSRVYPCDSLSLTAAALGSTAELIAFRIQVSASPGSKKITLALNATSIISH